MAIGAWRILGAVVKNSNVSKLWLISTVQGWWSFVTVGTAEGHEVGTLHCPHLLQILDLV